MRIRLYTTIHNNIMTLHNIKRDIIQPSFLKRIGAGGGIRTHVALRHGILSPAHPVSLRDLT